MRSARVVSRRAARSGAMIAFAALTMFAPAGAAQTPQAAMGGDAHPVHIHAGSCAALGDVVVPLADVTLPEGEYAGAETALPLQLSPNVVDMPMAELLSGDYAVNVHQSAEEIDVYIACGDLGGPVTQGPAGDEIRFALTEQNDSGYFGTVFVGAAGDRTQVNISLIAPEAMSETQPR
jgi:hypothetical protein